MLLTRLDHIGMIPTALRDLPGPLPRPEEAHKFFGLMKSVSVVME